jgi:hypothetical protein
MAKSITRGACFVKARVFDKGVKVCFTVKREGVLPGQKAGDVPHLTMLCSSFQGRSIEGGLR